MPITPVCSFIRKRAAKLYPFQVFQTSLRRSLDPRNYTSRPSFQMSDVESWMSDVRSRMLNVESRMSDVGCRMSDVGCRMSDVECRISDVESRMSDVGCWMSDGTYKLP